MILLKTGSQAANASWTREESNDKAGERRPSADIDGHNRYGDKMRSSTAQEKVPGAESSESVRLQGGYGAADDECRTDRPREVRLTFVGCPDHHGDHHHRVDHGENGGLYGNAQPDLRRTGFVGFVPKVLVEGVHNDRETTA